jgi:hypothetical protein
MDTMKSKLAKAAKGVRKRVRARTLTSLTAGLALVVGLAWNDAIGTFIKILFPVEANSIVPKFIYALAITFFVTLVIIGLEKALEEEDVKADS